MCDGPKCGWCNVSITEEQRAKIVVHTKDGRRIKPELVRKDFTVMQFDDGSGRYKLYNPQSGDVIVHEGDCDRKLTEAKRNREFSAA